MIHKIAFPLTRSAELKVYTPIIIAAIKRNIKVFLLCGPEPNKLWPKTPLYRPLKKNMHFPHDDKVTFLSFNNKHDAQKLLEKHEIEHLFILRYRADELPYQLDSITIRKYKLHALQFMADYLTFSPEYLKNIDTFFSYSPKMINLYKIVHPSANKQIISSKFISTGNPSFDNLSEIKKNRANIKKKYGLPSNKPIVIFLSLGLTTKLWRRYVFGAPNSLYNLYGAIRCRKWRLLKFLGSSPRQHDIIRTIKDWCHANNAVFVVKSRAKQNEPDYLMKQADHFITDTSNWYPYSTLELISIADLVINFNSTSLLESAACNVFNISIDLRSDDDPQGTGAKFVEDAYKHTEVTQQCDYKSLASFLAQHKLSDFSCNPNKQPEFVSTFTGQPNSQAADKILDHILGPNNPH